jgi:ribosomal protein S18 acetylase RimI-like enzyme
MISYRELLPSDLEAVFDVRVKTWHNANGAAEMLRLGITPEAVRELLRHSHRGWVAEEEHRIVGFTMGNRQTGEMWVIAVLPEFENRGIGKRLMALVEAWLWSTGWAEIWLTTDSDEAFRAVGFYRRLGWRDWKFENGDRFMRKVQPPANPAVRLLT